MIISSLREGLHAATPYMEFGSIANKAQDQVAWITTIETLTVTALVFTTPVKDFWLQIYLITGTHCLILFPKNRQDARNDNSIF